MEQARSSGPLEQRRHGRFGRNPLRKLRQRQLQPGGRDQRRRVDPLQRLRRRAGDDRRAQGGAARSCPRSFGGGAAERSRPAARRQAIGGSPVRSQPMRILLAPALALLLAIPASARQSDVTAADRAAHQRMIVLDTHLDIPERWDDGQWDFGARHRGGEDRSQVDLPRMDEGGLDGGFLVIYTPQGALTQEGYREARDAALVRAAAIRRVLGENRARIGLALTPDDALRLARAGRHFAFISMENSWPLGEDLSLLTTFYRLGVRLAGPVHFKNNQLGDSATDTPHWNGLSPLGRSWVAEMNRLGILIDASHSSDAVFDQLLELSRVPIIASHSGPRAIYNHPRNLDDGRMRRLAAAGGLMMINSVYLAPADNSHEREAINDRHKNWANLSAAERARLLRDEAALNRLR